MTEDPRNAEGQPIDEGALDTISVAPGDPEENEHVHHPRQNAGQDESIARRLERDPESQEAQLDAGLDESMDASDPPASTQPGSTEPAVSSGYDPDEEARIKAAQDR